MPISWLSSWLPSVTPIVWILSVGRFVSEVGTGFTLFYAPIFFVNQVGLSATTVGLALGISTVSGTIGRILGGSLADSPRWGRRRTLLLALAISVIGSFVLATTKNFEILVFASLISGLGTGLYWPPMEAVIADVTKTENLREAFALNRLADNLGLSLGIILAGFLLTMTGNYRSLFIIDAVSFIVFFLVVYGAISEAEQPQMTLPPKTQHFASWRLALSDRSLLVFVAANLIFTTYISQIHSTIPLYFQNFVNSGQGFATTTISALFAWHSVLAMLCQVPITRALKRLSHTHTLTIAAILWGIGFSLIGITGIAPSHRLLWAALALGVLAIAIVTYTPAAAAFVTELAPTSQRGVYFSISSISWALGNIIGSPLGGWALDQPQIVVYCLWFSFCLGVLLIVAIMQYLKRILPSQ